MCWRVRSPILALKKQGSHIFLVGRQCKILGSQGYAKMCSREIFMDAYFEFNYFVDISTPNEYSTRLDPEDNKVDPDLFGGEINLPLVSDRDNNGTDASEGVCSLLPTKPRAPRGCFTLNRAFQFHWFCTGTEALQNVHAALQACLFHFQRIQLCGDLRKGMLAFRQFLFLLLTKFLRHP